MTFAHGGNGCGRTKDTVGVVNVSLVHPIGNIQQLFLRTTNNYCTIAIARGGWRSTLELPVVSSSLVMISMFETAATGGNGGREILRRTLLLGQEYFHRKQAG
jgi:hypothetical protein